MGELLPFRRKATPAAPFGASRETRLATARALVETYAVCFRHERAVLDALRDGDLVRAVLRIDLLLTGRPACATADPLFYQTRRAAELLDLVIAAHARNNSTGACA